MINAFKDYFIREIGYIVEGHLYDVKINFTQGVHHPEVNPIDRKDYRTNVFCWEFSKRGNWRHLKGTVIPLHPFEVTAGDFTIREVITKMNMPWMLPVMSFFSWHQTAHAGLIFGNRSGKDKLRFVQEYMEDLVDMGIARRTVGKWKNDKKGISDGRI